MSSSQASSGMPAETIYKNQTTQRFNTMQNNLKNLLQIEAILENLFEIEPTNFTRQTRRFSESHLENQVFFLLITKTTIWRFQTAKFNWHYAAVPWFGADSEPGPWP